MRRFLCLVLAVVMAVSMSVIAVGAVDGEDMATVTLTSVTGESVTETFAVGQTFTATVFLNTAQINEGKVASFDGEQDYTSDVLELQDAYETDNTAFDFGMVSDPASMFPVTGAITVANAGAEPGKIYFNASSNASFTYDSDDCRLMVTTYTVKAPGTATITNSFLTLAASDFYLSRIVDEYEIVNSNFTSKVAFGTSSSIGGTFTSYLNKPGIKIELLKDGESVQNVTFNDDAGSYSFSNIANGTYSVRVSKESHVERVYENVKAGSSLNVQICPIGDANLNGVVDMRDYAAAYKHVMKTKLLTGYALDCANANGKGGVDMKDYAAIYKHVMKTKLLF